MKNKLIRQVLLTKGATLGTGLQLLELRTACSLAILKNKFIDNIRTQLWPIRNQLSENPQKTLKTNAEAGYKPVELIDICYVEQDFSPDPIKSIRESIIYPKTLLVKMPVIHMLKWNWLFATLIICACCKSPDNQDWRYYLGDANSSQYADLDQINKDNVTGLQVAWHYQTGDNDPENRSQIQCNPLIIDGILYGSSPKLKFFAIDAATGKEIWTFNPFDDDHDQFGMGVNRGLAYWEDQHSKKLMVTAGSYLYAINAESGKLFGDFGDHGRVDLHAGLGRNVEDRIIASNSPGVIYEDMLILGSMVSEELGAAPGHVRAYNVHTGKIEWIFNTIPKPNEFGADTWPKDAYQQIGGANAWSGMSLDSEQGIVYIPTGSASYDFYGADRAGQNLFANCILALDAKTGKRIWHYQTVHHDIWDRDLPAPPNLVTLNHEGKKIPALAQITKSGHVFILDRTTGQPVFPIPEVAVTPSGLPYEQVWPTQPIPTKPPPFARQSFTNNDINNFSAENYDYVKQLLAPTLTGKQFLPPSEQGTVIFPGFDGGGEWGGAAFDPNSGILYVNANEMPWILTMIPVKNDQSDLAYNKGMGIYRQYCAGCHGVNKKGGDFMNKVPGIEHISERYSSLALKELLENGKGNMPSFKWLQKRQIDWLKDYLFDLKEKRIDPEKSQDFKIENQTYTDTGYFRFKDPDGYPAIKPPWGTLNAIDLNKGEILWQVPLGEFKELSAKGIPVTGTENYGGPIITRAGLLFIAATQDEKIRAFDTSNGAILWEYALPAGGYATPSTYQINGKQFVVIACGGGKMGTKSGDSYMAFSLPN